MEAAIANNDLAMVQQIHALHPDPLVVRSLRGAMEHGTLEMVQWVVEHRHDQLCCQPGFRNLCQACLVCALLSLGKQDAVRVVHWLVSQGTEFVVVDIHWPLFYAALRSAELLRWCYARWPIPLKVGNLMLFRATDSCNADSLAVTEFLLSKGCTVSSSRLISMMIEASCHPAGAATLAVLVSSSMCDPIRHQFECAPTRPGGAIVLQWSDAFMTDPANRELVDWIANRASYWLHLDTLKWLHEVRGVISPECQWVRPSAQDDLLRYHEWRLDVGLTDWSANDMMKAVDYGYLGVVQWLHAHSTVRFTAATMDWAAASGHLHIVKWLHEHSPVGCTARAMDRAACYGHLDVIRWLHHNRVEGCTDEAFEAAARKGHLEIVQWLCENRTLSNATKLLEAAACEGQLAVCQWVIENRPDACVSCARRTVLWSHKPHKGLLNVLRLLHEHVPSVACNRRCGDPNVPQEYFLGRSAVNAGDLPQLAFILENRLETDTRSQLLRIALASSPWRPPHTGIVRYLRRGLFSN